MSQSSLAGVAGTWSLNLSHTVPSADTFFASGYNDESIISADNRRRVDPSDFKEGGKYRSIVKLQVRYDGQDPDDTRYTMGTGWLINPDTIVTSGSNVFDWSGDGRGLGRAIHIKCYIGYYGRDSIDSPTVQSRLAKTIVTTAEWIISKENRHRDVAFIRLDRPFHGHLGIFKYNSTPIKDVAMLGIVGYPADKVQSGKDDREEAGASIYEVFSTVEYNLQPNSNNPLSLLECRISPFGGQNGSPVLHKGEIGMSAIGTHVYGGGINSQASAIGPLGNDYDSLLRVFNDELPVVGEQAGIKLVRHLDPAIFNPPAHPRLQAELIEPLSVEDFYLDLKSIMKAAVQHPLFAYFSAIAGTALGFFSHAAEFAVEATDSASATAMAVSKSATERAILAEATLQAVLRLDGEDSTTREILEDMQRTYTAQARPLKQLAPQLTHVLVDAARQISTHKKVIARQDDRADNQERNMTPQFLPGVDHSESAGLSDFATLMLTPTKPVPGEEDTFAELGSIINKALNPGAFLLRQATGQRYLEEIALGPTSGSEGGFAGLFGLAVIRTDIGSSDRDISQVLVIRALFAEAALQAVSKLEAKTIHRLAVAVPYFPQAGYPDSDDFVDFVKMEAQKTGGVVRLAAADVIKAVVPITVEAILRRRSLESGSR